MLEHLVHVPLPVAEKILRPLLVYVFLVLALRLFGKRELLQLNPFDLVVLLALSNTVQNAIIGEDNSLVGGLIGALALLAVNYLVVRFLFRHRRLDELLEGSPVALVENGRIQEKALARELLTRSELMALAHRQGISRVDDIKTCVLESGGTCFIERKEPALDERRHKELLARLDHLEQELKKWKP